MWRASTARRACEQVLAEGVTAGDHGDKWRYRPGDGAFKSFAVMIESYVAFSLGKFPCHNLQQFLLLRCN